MSKNRLGWSFIDIASFVFLIFCTILVLGYFALQFYVILVYGSVPISECPTWVVWMLNLGGGK